MGDFASSTRGDDASSPADDGSESHKQGMVYYDAFKHSEAKPLLERALSLRTSVLGAGHADTKATAAILERVIAYEMRGADELDDVHEAANPDHDFVAEDNDPERENDPSPSGASHSGTSAPALPLLSSKFASMANDGNAEDAMCTRGRLRQLIDLAEQAKEQAERAAIEAVSLTPCDEADTQPDETKTALDEDGALKPRRRPVNCHVMPPHGLQHKQTLCIHLNVACRRGDEQLFADRGLRVSQAAKLASMDETDNSTLARCGMVNRSTDICAVFKPETPKDAPSYVAYGRVLAMYDSKHELSKPVPFESRDKIQCVARWYEAADSTGLSFTYTEDGISRYDGM